MANIKSQVKRNRQNERRRQRNMAARSELKTEAKKVRSAAERGDREAAGDALRTASRMLDTAASKGVVHPRTAARRKAKLARSASAAS